MIKILDADGTEIETKKQEPQLSRAERRRIKHDPLAHQKYIAGSPRAKEEYRLMAYGQILVYKLSDLQMRMAGVPYARPRRPEGSREELSKKIALEWEETAAKIEGVQAEMTALEEKNKQESVDLLKVQK